MKPGYKQTEVGVIPEDWDALPLGSAIKLQSGYSFQSINFSDIGVPVIRISDIQDGVVRSDRAVHHPTIKISPEFVIRGGDVLVAMSGATTGKVGTYSENGIAYQNQRVGRFVVRDCKLTLHDYIKQVVSAPTFGAGLTNMLEQGAQPNISGRQIESLLCPFPRELPEQRAIAEALSDVDGLLGGLDRLIAKKRDLKQAAMQQLLTAQTRLPGFHGEWVEKPLSEVASIRSGGTFSTTSLRFWNGDVLWCTPTDITALDGRKYLTGTERTITSEGFEASSAELIPARSVIMTSRATIGACAINTVPVTTNQGFKNFVPFESTDVEFLYYLLSTQTQRFISLCGGSTFLEIGKAQLMPFVVRVPATKAEQTAIAEVLSEMDAELEAMERRREKTRALKQAMMQQLLTGQTRLVPPA
jgi:type I restriction enzyme S subunit